MKKTLIFLFFIFICGCLGPIKINMQEHYNAMSCPITVIDMRPDQRIITGLDNAIFDLSPSVRDFLHAKLCENKKINEASKSSKMIIKIRDLKYHGIVKYFSAERILIIDGSLQYLEKSHDIQTGGNLESTGKKLDEDMPVLLNDATDKFVATVEDYIK